MPHLHVITGFGSMSDHAIETLASGVSTGLYGNSAYPTPPVTKAVLDADNAAFGLAIAAAKAGGPTATADKNNKRTTLTGLLHQLATYVQANQGDNLATLLSSGFQAASTGHVPAPVLPSIPVIHSVTNGAAGQLIAHLEHPVPNNYGYDVRYAAVGAGGVLGAYQSAGHFTDSRSMPVNGLTPGTLYSIQACTHLSGNRTSDWSVAVQHMCM